MNERLAKVLEYEDRLLQDRQQLQRLIEESDGKNPLISLCGTGQKNRTAADTKVFVTDPFWGL